MFVAPSPPACERTHSTASCGISGKAQPTNSHLTRSLERRTCMYPNGTFFLRLLDGSHLKWHR